MKVKKKNRNRNKILKKSVYFIHKKERKYNKIKMKIKVKLKKAHLIDSLTI